MRDMLNYRKPTIFVRRIVPGLIIWLWLCPALALACSGDGAPDLIEHNRTETHRLAALSVALLVATVVLYFKRRKKGLRIIALSLVLMALHPAWHYGGGGGDCGMSMVGVSQWIAVFLSAGVAYQLIRCLVKRRGAIEGRA